MLLLLLLLLLCTASGYFSGYQTSKIGRAKIHTIIIILLSHTRTHNPLGHFRKWSVFCPVDCLSIFFVVANHLNEPQKKIFFYRLRLSEQTGQNVEFFNAFQSHSLIFIFVSTRDKTFLSFHCDEWIFFDIFNVTAPLPLTNWPINHEERKFSKSTEVEIN